jgi:DNA-directed RNA polymerase specialized sigma24 family protein
LPAIPHIDGTIAEAIASEPMPADGIEADERQVRRVYGFFALRLRSPAEAERLTRITFERALRAPARALRDRDGPEVSVTPEVRLLAVAREVIAANRLRSRALPPGLSPDIATAIGRLGQHERDALALRFGAELGIAEIAQLLDRTPADVKQRIARGVRRLHELGVEEGTRAPRSG